MHPLDDSRDEPTLFAEIIEEIFLLPFVPDETEV